MGSRCWTATFTRWIHGGRHERRTQVRGLRHAHHGTARPVRALPRRAVQGAGHPPHRQGRPPAPGHHRHRRPADHPGRRAAAVPQARAAGPTHSTQPLSGSRLADTGRLDFAIERELRRGGAGDGHGDGGRGHRRALPHHRPQPHRPRPPRPVALPRPVRGLQQLDRRVLPAQPGPAQVRGDAARARRAPGLPRAAALRAGAGRRRVLRAPQPRERPLLALELLGAALQPARGART